ncbi:MAG TPA: GYD domain-containing protein, partial [Acetobacteraceae bacterium]|nr:GYD domain-containing protein [Acetobacteraceae bacterium]
MAPLPGRGARRHYPQRGGVCRRGREGGRHDDVRRARQLDRPGGARGRRLARRLDAAKRTLEEMGGRFVSLLMTMGEHDLVLVYEAPDDAVAARFTLLLGKQGSVR